MRKSQGDVPPIKFEPRHYIGQGIRARADFKDFSQGSCGGQAGRQWPAFSCSGLGHSTLPV